MVLLLGMLVGVTSCAATPGKGEETTVENPDVDQPDAALLEQIKRDYFYHFYNSFYEYDPETSVIVDQCYGVYNGCVAVRLSAVGYGDYFGVLMDEEVENVVFHYWSSQKIEVWKDGVFYSLQEAYDEKLLTLTDLQSIAKIQNAWYREDIIT